MQPCVEAHMDRNQFYQHQPASHVCKLPDKRIFSQNLVRINSHMRGLNRNYLSSHFQTPDSRILGKTINHYYFYDHFILSLFLLLFYSIIFIITSFLFLSY